MHSEQEKSLRNFEKEPQFELEPKDFVSDVVVMPEPHKENPAEAPP